MSFTASPRTVEAGAFRNICLVFWSDRERRWEDGSMRGWERRRVGRKRERARERLGVDQRKQTGCFSVRRRPSLHTHKLRTSSYFRAKLVYFISLLSALSFRSYSFPLNLAFAATIDPQRILQWNFHSLTYSVNRGIIWSMVKWNTKHTYSSLFHVRCFPYHLWREYISVCDWSNWLEFNYWIDQEHCKAKFL